MSLRTFDSKHSPQGLAAPSRLTAVLASGLTNVKTANDAQYVVKRGYWATSTSSVYDVEITTQGRVVAVVGFMDKIQKKGALFWKVGHKEQAEFMADEAIILDLARSYAQDATGWDLSYRKNDRDH